MPDITYTSRNWDYQLIVESWDFRTAIVMNHYKGKRLVIWTGE